MAGIVKGELGTNEKYYPTGYKPRPIEEQVDTLRSLVPELEKGQAIEYLALQVKPPGLDGWYAIPTWPYIDKTYNSALKRVVGVIIKKYGSRFSVNLPDRNCFSENHIRQTLDSAEGLEITSEDQGSSSSIMILPAQLGLRYKGSSALRARNSFIEYEFGLGLLEVLCMFLANPQRLEHDDDLGIDCPGTQYHRNGIPGYPFVPYLRFKGRDFQVGARRANVPSKSYGSSTAFLFQ
jgi:hypothetical protein